MANQLVHQAEQEIADNVLGRKVIELLEELPIRRFSQYNREEIRKMFKLADIRKTAVWKEAQEEAKEERDRQWVQKCLAKRMSVKEIAELMDISVREVRRLAKDTTK